jgi:hypothetical protein
MTRRTTRRVLLGGIAGAVAGLAGCGYRAGGGELRWRSSNFHAADGVVFDDGTLLLVTRETMAYDFEAEQWYRGGHVATLAPERGEGTDGYGFATATRTAALGDDTLYAGQTDGTVTAVRLGGGDGDTEPGATTPGAESEPERWTASTGVAPSGVDALAADAGTAYAGGSNGLAALAADGDVRWRWRDGPVDAAVTGVKGVAVLALATDRLVALADDGSVRWAHGVTPTGSGSAVPSPLVGPEGVYLADGAGVTALARDGSVRWERDVPDPAGRPALTDEGLYHASATGTVRSLSLDGRERWRHDPRGAVRSRVAAADGRAFLLAGESLVAVGPEGTAWRVPLDDPEPFAPEFGPFAAGETLVLGGAREVRGYWQSQLRRERR